MSAECDKHCEEFNKLYEKIVSRICALIYEFIADTLNFDDLILI